MRQGTKHTKTATQNEQNLNANATPSGNDRLEVHSKFSRETIGPQKMWAFHGSENIYNYRKYVLYNQYVKEYKADLVMYLPIPR